MVDAQTYKNGYKTIALSEVAISPLLTSDQRITRDRAIKIVKQVDAKSIYNETSDLPGESWWIDGMLVNFIVRKISNEFPLESLQGLRKSYSPELLSIKESTPDRIYFDEWFSEIKSVNNFDVLVYYYMTKAYKKSFFIQDKKGRYKIMGAIFIKKEDAAKAHQLIETILNGLSFVE